jgi:hypothetical protein
MGFVTLDLLLSHPLIVATNNTETTMSPKHNSGFNASADDNNHIFKLGKHDEYGQGFKNGSILSIYKLYCN